MGTLYVQLLTQFYTDSHGLKMCMWFVYNPQINFCHFFKDVNLEIVRPSVLSMSLRLTNGYVLFLFFFSENKVKFTYLFHDSSYIQRQT